MNEKHKIFSCIFRTFLNKQSFKMLCKTHDKVKSDYPCSHNNIYIKNEIRKL